MPEQTPRWWQDTPHELDGLKKGVIKKMVSAGYLTPQQIREAGPQKLLKEVEGLGKKGLDDIKIWLRSLDGEAEPQA
jgi:hypothetical protein